MLTSSFEAMWPQNCPQVGGEKLWRWSFGVHSSEPLRSWPTKQRGSSSARWRGITGGRSPATCHPRSKLLFFSIPRKLRRCRVFFSCAMLMVSKDRSSSTNLKPSRHFISGCINNMGLSSLNSLISSLVFDIFSSVFSLYTMTTTFGRSLPSPRDETPPSRLYFQQT